nr:NADH-quinone oxidoreductase subunit NuoE [bacterium]
MQKNSAFSAEQYDKLHQVIAEYRDMPGPLMPVMQKAQEIFGYLPIEVQNEIADGLGIPMTDVYGVATFYSQFTLEPRGQHTIGICMGTACYVKNAALVLEALKKNLGVEVGKTTEDGLFTLDATRCLGCCGLAPVITIDETVYGRMTPDEVPGILAKYKA